MATLRIYRAPSGQWSGQLIEDDGTPVAGVAGCACADDVEGEAQDAGFEYTEAIYEE